jgi:hypothetical protein
VPVDLPPAALAFQRAANAMSAAAAAMPASVSYEVRVHVHSWGDQDYRYHYDLERRTAKAAVRVDAGPAPDGEGPWPLDPTFDALARFVTTGQWEAGGRNEIRFANDPRLLRYDLTKPAGVDAVAFSVKDYVVRYASEAGLGPGRIRLDLTATPALEARETVFRSAIIDTTTWLPVQVTMHTPFGHSAVTIDYASVQGHPVVTHFDIRRTLRVLFAARTLSTEAWFEEIRFGEPVAPPTKDEGA